MYRVIYSRLRYVHDNNNDYGLMKLLATGQCIKLWSFFDFQTRITFTAVRKCVCVVPRWHALFVWWLRNGSQSKDSFLLGWQITIKTCCRKQTITSSSFSDILESLTCGLVVGLLSFWKGSDAMIFFIHYRSNIFLTFPACF